MARTPDQLRNANLAFTLELEEVPVTIGGTQYTLRELDGKARDTYLNDLANRIKTVGAGKAATQSVKNFDGLQSGLLARCLYDSGGKLVPASTIQSWPARVVSDLFDAAKELSGIDKEEEDDEGNE